MKTKEEIIEWCEILEIKEYTINEDMSIDVDTHVNLIGRSFEKFPITFNKVWGSFLCNTGNLTTLEGSPKYVGQDFKCNSNNLTSLKGGPEKVEGNFNCAGNDKLINLNGSPKYVGGFFRCGPNDLTSLDSDTEYVGGNFICSDTRITSLTGAPKKVYGSIKCSWTHLREFGDFNTEGFKHVYVLQTPLSPLFPVDREIERDMVETFITFKIIKDGKVNIKRLKYFHSLYGVNILEYDMKRIKNNFDLI